jgi:hypothetical protein
MRPWCETSMHYFSCLGGTGADSIIKPVGTRYDKLVFLHQVLSADHVVNSCASGSRDVDALLFVLMWYRYGFRKNRVGIHYGKLQFCHLVGSPVHVVHFSAYGA